MEWSLTELAANFVYPVKNKDERVSVITYGRNYIIEPINVLLDRYEKSKEAGSNSAILDKELEEWVIAKFKTDPIGLNEEQKRLKVEPFIHFTIEQVSSIYGAYDARCKMLFPDWWRNKANKEADALVLKSEFAAYCEETIGINDDIEDGSSEEEKAKIGFK
jgi:hypothetical protein